MPEDGRLEFNTEIETGGFEKDLKSITKLVEKISKTITTVSDNIKKMIAGTQSQTSSLNSTVEDTDRVIDRTSDEMRELSSVSENTSRALDNLSDSAGDTENEVQELGSTADRTSNKNEQFEKSVSDINQELKLLDSQMKLVKAQYDKNDTSTQSLTAQNKVLNDEIELQKQKIDVLRQALQNSSEQYGENDRKTQQWKIQLNNAEAALSGMERSLKHNNEVLERNAEDLNHAERQSQEFGNETEDTSEEIEELGDQSKKTAAKVENLGDKADKAENKFSGLKSMASRLKDSLATVAEVAGKAIIGVSAGILGAGTASTNVGMNFESAMSKVSAISGATGESFDVLTEKAKEMGASTKFSAAESAEAFQYMAMAGWDTEKMLNGIDGIMSLSAADGLDLATTSDIVTDALTAFGLEAGQATHFADVLAAASGSANTNVSMLGESFKYIAPLAGAMNYSVEDVSLALGLMANASVKGSMAGTSLKTSLANLSSPTKDMAAALEKLGLAAYETNTEIDQLEVDKAANNKKQAVEKLDTAQKKYDEAVKKYGENSDEARKLSLKLESAQNNLAAANEKLAKAQAGDTKQTGVLVTAMQNADGTMKPLRETLVELRKAFSTLDEAQQAEYASTIFGKEAMSGMLAVINAGDEDFNQLTDNLANADGAAKSMADTLNDNLQGDITIAQSALEGFGIVIYETLDDKLREAVQLGTGYIDRLSKAFTNGGLQEAVSVAGDIFGEVVVKVSEYAPQLMDTAIDFIRSFGDTLLDMLPRTVREPIADVIDNIKDTVSDIGNVLVSVFSSEDIKNAVVFVTKLIGDFANTLLDVVKDILPSFENAVRTVKRGLESSEFNSGIKAAKDIIKDLGSVVSNVTKTALPVMAGVIEKIAANLDVLLPLAVGTVTAFKTWKIISNVINWGKNLSLAITALTTNITAQSVAEDILQMKINGTTTAMSLQQVAAGLLTGKITLHEAATWLATKAQTAFNAVLSANPVVLVTAAVAGLVAGLSVLVTWLATTQGSTKEYNEAVEKMQESGEKAKESAENFGKSLSGISDGADDFVESINNSKSALDGIDDSAILNTQKMSELQENMEEVQTKITAITSAYSDERKQYTEEEVKALDELFQKQLELVEQQLKEMSTYQTVARGRAETFVLDFNGTSEEYAEESKKYIKAAQDAKDKVITVAEEQYNKQLAQITLMKGLSEQERQQKKAAAKKLYEDSIQTASKEYSDTMAVITDGYNARNNAAVDFQNKMADLRKDRLKIMDDYNKKAAEINEKYADDETRHRIEITKITDKYNQDMADLYDKHNQDFDESTKNEMAVWLGFVKSVDENGGQITQETADMCQNMLDELSVLPPESQAEMQDMIDKIQAVMDKLPPAMRKKAEETSTAWINEEKKLPQLARSSTNDVRNAIIDELGNIPPQCRDKANEMVTAYASQITSANNIAAIKDAGTAIRQALADSLTWNDYTQAMNDVTISPMEKVLMNESGSSTSWFNTAWGDDVTLGRLKSAVVSQSSGVSQMLSSKSTSTSSANNSGNSTIRASGNIQTHISIDGREFAVATTPYIDEELAFKR